MEYTVDYLSQQLIDSIGAYADRDIETMKILVKKGANVNYESVSENGHGYHWIITPLLQACSFGGDLEMAKFLVKKGADIEISDESSRTPIFEAVHSENFELVKFLAEKGAILYEYDSDKDSHYSPLIRAIYTGNLKIIKYLMKKDPYIINPDALYGREYTPLYHAICTKRFKTIKCLVKNGADLNYESYDTDEPPSLVFAIENRSSEKIIKFLLDNGADVNKGCEENGFVISPLLDALQNESSEDIIKLLLNSGADYEEILNHPEIDGEIKSDLRKLIK